MSLRSRLAGALIRLVVKSAGAGWSMTLGGMEDLLRGAFVRPSKAGKVVNEETAFYSTTVLAVVTRIAFGFAQVPWKVFRDLDGGGKEEARDHYLWKLLHRKPNDFQTSFNFRVTMMFHLLFLGRFLAFVNRVDNKIVELLPLTKGSVERKRGTFELQYFLTGDDGHKREIPKENIWHVIGPSWNGWEGLKGLELARETIGLAIAAEENQIDLQKRGSRIPGVIGLEGNVGKENYKDLSAWIRDQVQKDIAETGVMMIDKAAKFYPTMMSGLDAETLATRKHQAGEVCRHFGMLPVMIGLGEGADGFASAEQKNMWHTVHTLDPWWVLTEQSAECQLLRDDEGDISINFIRAGMMRAAMKDQYEAFAIALGRGATGEGQQFMLPNEVRALIEMNPVQGWSKPAVFAAPAAVPPKVTS